MLKKSLIALVLVALCSGPALAHVSWGYGQTTTITWEWESRPGPVIDVCIKVVMWAKLYASGCLLVHQIDGGLFEGCKEVQLCVNFKGIEIEVQYIEITQVSKYHKDNNKGKYYKISIDEVGQKNYNKDWEKSPTQSIEIDTLHLATASGGAGNKKLDICLMIRDVDPQYLEYTGGQAVKIGEITTLLTPTLMPPTVVGGVTEYTAQFNRNPDGSPYIP